MVSTAMSLAQAEIPSDPAALRVFAKALQTEIALRDAEIYAKTLLIEKIKAQLAALRRARYGRSSEKLDRDIEQLELMLGDLEEGDAESRARTRKVAGDDAAAPEKSEEAKGRKPLPEHLPREETLHEAACSCPSCGGTKFSRIGEDRREVLEYVPSHFKVVVHVRPKLSCRGCETIVQAPMPSLPIERGRPGPGLIAHVLAAKYCDHLPLYRQSEIYARDGVDLERSTLADWVGGAAFLLAPLAEAIARHARAGSTVHADDTPVPVLDPGRGRTKTGRLWVLVRDERSWGSAIPPAAYYRYGPDRKTEQAMALLEGCRGFLHADAYAGFKELYKPDATGQPILTEVACWAHARRQIYEAHQKTKSPLSEGALERIAALFAVEKAVNGKEPAERLASRQEKSLPLLAELKAFYDQALAKISAKSSLAGAIRYSLTRWEALLRYTTDGRLEMTNNAAERAIRPLALGRKNWLFAGSDTGGDRAAMMYTIIQTAKLNGIDPEAYLRDILARIADHPISKIDQLLPWNGAKRAT